MNLDIRLPGMVDTASANAAKALASTPGTGAPGDSFSTSFSSTLARLAAASTDKRLALADATAVPAAGILPQAAAPAPGSLLADLSGLHQLLADQHAEQPDTIVSADSAVSPDSHLPAALPLVAGDITGHHESDIAEVMAPADMAAAPVDTQTDTGADALAALQGFAADSGAAIPAAAAAAGQSATGAGGIPSLQGARPGPVTAAAKQPLAQHGSAAAHAGAGDTAALLLQPASGIADRSFALADHELELQGVAGSHEAGAHHSMFSPVMNNQGTGQPAISGSASATLASPLATPQWQQEFSQQMVSLVQRGDQRVSLHLNPAELGPLVVDLKLSEHHALLQFASAHGQVRSALEQALPQLRDALAEQGITLGETHIGSERGEQQASSFQSGTHESGHDSLRGGDRPVSPDVASATAPMPLDGRVNLYV